MDPGRLAWDYPVEMQAGLDWAVQGGLPGHAELAVGPLNSLLNHQTAAALHGVLSAPGATRQVMVPIGFRAAPAAGDPVYVGAFEQLTYNQVAGTSMVTATLDFAPSILSGLAYSKPWGRLLKASGNVAAVNSAAGIDDGAATAAGGFMAYQVFGYTTAGSVVIKVQDSADNSTFADLSGATVSLAHTAIPAAGIVQLAVTATVRQYLRWQIVFTGMTGVNFALAFVRG